MTDKEIIKALECCATNDETMCEQCPYDRKGCLMLPLYAIDLINRQQAEIERLNKVITFKLKEEQLEQIKTECLESIDYNIKEIKAEGIKEFAEKIKEEIAKALESNYKARAEKENENIDFNSDIIWHYCTGKIHCLQGIDGFIDYTSKEMAGE